MLASFPGSIAHVIEWVFYIEIEVFWKERKKRELEDQEGYCPIRLLCRDRASPSLCRDRVSCVETWSLGRAHDKAWACAAGRTRDNNACARDKASWL